MPESKHSEVDTGKKRFLYSEIVGSFVDPATEPLGRERGYTISVRGEQEHRDNTGVSTLRERMSCDQRDGYQYTKQTKKIFEEENFYDYSI